MDMDARQEVFRKKVERENEQKDILFRFKAKYPNHRGLDIITMKAILDGDKVIVKIAGTHKFQIMTKEEVAPGGKLDKINAKIAFENKRIRQINKEIKQGNDKMVRELFGDVLMDTLKNLR